MNFYDEKTFDDLLKEFSRCMRLKREDLFELLGFDKENMSGLLESFNLDVLNDKQVETLKNILDGYIKSEEYEKRVPDDEEEYCWNMATAMIKKCDNEITKRNPEMQNGRTNR